MKHIPSFNNFVNENDLSEGISFNEIKDKYLENPYGIGANSVEYVEGKNGNPAMLIFRDEDKRGRDNIEAKLKTMGVPAKKLSKSMADKSYKYPYELIMFESESNTNESNNWGTYNTAEGAAVAKELNKAYDKLTSDVEKAFDAYKKAVKVYTNGPKKELGNKSGFNDTEGESAITWGIKDMLAKIFKVDTNNMYYDAFWMFEGKDE